MSFWFYQLYERHWMARKRVLKTIMTVSLNDIVENPLHIPTLHETTTDVMFKDGGLHSRLQCLKDNTTVENPFLKLFGGGNWCGPDPQKQGEEIVKCAKNYISSLTAPAHLLRVMGEDVKTEKFYFALTYEQPNPDFPIASKYRAMLMRKENLDAIHWWAIHQDRGNHPAKPTSGPLKQRWKYLELWAKILHDPDHEWHASLKECWLDLAVPSTAPKLVVLEGKLTALEAQMTKQTELMQSLLQRLDAQSSGEREVANAGG